MEIKAILGVGNPGKDYESTHHNVGVLFIDFLVNKLGGELKEKSKIPYYLANIGGRDLLLFKPYSKDVFMNDSGLYARDLVRKFNLLPEEMLIAQDESDLPLGKYKYSFASGSAGHKGIISIIDSLKTKNFTRLRIGIRKQKGKALDFVLRRIPKSDLEILNRVFELALDSLETKLRNRTNS